MRVLGQRVRGVSTGSAGRRDDASREFGLWRKLSSALRLVEIQDSTLGLIVIELTAAAVADAWVWPEEAPV